MRPGARLIIIERLLESDPVKCCPFDLLLDLPMLVLHQGQERTAAQFNELMAKSGFAPIVPKLVRPTFSIFETSPNRKA
jgi:hypothetical protein